MHKFNLLTAAMTMAIATSSTHAQNPPVKYLQDSPAEYLQEPPLFEADSQVNAPAPIACEGCGDVGCSGGGCDDCSCGKADFGAWGRCKCRQQAKWWGFPEEFKELPLGCASNPILQAQAARGVEARLTLYEYDFIDGTSDLNARGRTRLAKLASVALRSGSSITIQPTLSQLDAPRLASVQAMAAESLDLHPDQIVLATPLAAGLGGEEASVIRQNHLQHTGQNGVRQFSFGSFSFGSAGR